MDSVDKAKITDHLQGCEPGATMSIQAEFELWGESIEEIDKLLRVDFIRSTKIVVIPKKNGKLRVCVNYKKLNVATEIDAFSWDLFSKPPRATSTSWL